jgi:hypothetical protein
MFEPIYNSKTVTIILKIPHEVFQTNLLQTLGTVRKTEKNVNAIIFALVKK